MPPNVVACHMLGVKICAALSVFTVLHHLPCLVACLSNPDFSDGTLNEAVRRMLCLQWESRFFSRRSFSLSLSKSTLPPSTLLVSVIPSPGVTPHLHRRLS